MDKSSVKDSKDLIYHLDGRPSLLVAIPMGLQHVLAMFIGNIAPLLVISGIITKATPGLNMAILLQCAMLAAGVTTFMQLYPIKIGKIQIGAGLPIVMGTSFATVSTSATIGAIGGLPAIIGGTLTASIIQYIVGFFYPVLKRIFPPVVIGVIIIAIGLQLLPVGAAYFGGGAGAKDYGSWQNLTLAFSVFIIVTLLQKFGKGTLKTASVLIALVVGYIMAGFLGKLNLSPVADAAWFGVPIPLLYGISFSWEATLAFIPVALVLALETIGNTSGITMAAFNRQATKKETAGAILADAVGSSFASVFNVLPSTAYGQNVGIVAMTKVVNRFCIGVGAGLLVLASFVPKLAAVFQSMPSSVLGGAVISVFGIILVNGMKLIAEGKFVENDVVVASISLGVGYAISKDPNIVKSLQEPLKFIFHDATTCVFIIATLTNMLFNFKSVFGKQAEDSAEA